MPVDDDVDVAGSGCAVVMVDGAVGDVDDVAAVDEVVGVWCRG